MAFSLAYFALFFRRSVVIQALSFPFGYPANRVARPSFDDWMIAVQEGPAVMRYEAMRRAILTATTPADFKRIGREVRWTDFVSLKQLIVPLWISVLNHADNGMSLSELRAFSHFLEHGAVVGSPNADSRSAWIEFCLEQAREACKDEGSSLNVLYAMRQPFMCAIGLSPLSGEGWENDPRVRDVLEELRTRILSFPLNEELFSPIWGITTYDAGFERELMQKAGMLDGAADGHAAA